MSAQHMAVIEDCDRQSLAGTMIFSEVVRRLSEAGVERYHADLSRGEKTYYLTQEETVVYNDALPTAAIADPFSASSIEEAIRASQRGEIRYGEFLKRIAAAGCVGYLVHLAGRNALYLGRRGESHLEPFAQPKT